MEMPTTTSGGKSVAEAFLLSPAQQPRCGNFPISNSSERRNDLAKVFVMLKPDRKVKNDLGSV